MWERCIYTEEIEINRKTNRYPKSIVKNIAQIFPNESTVLNPFEILNLEFFPTSLSSDQFKRFGLNEIQISATYYKIDKKVLTKEWCSSCLEFKEIKTTWLKFKQNVDSNGLKLKTTATVWSLSYIINSSIESEESHPFIELQKLY